jgi:hypothetical protein
MTVPEIVESVKYAFKNPMQVLRDTSIEVIIGACLGAVILGGISHTIESRRDKKIPLGFSEITQIERDARYSGKEVGALTRYLTSVNDASMKVFECWNLANNSYSTVFSDKTEYFAKELERKMDPALKIHHYELYDFLRDMPGQARDAKKGLTDFIKVKDLIAPVNYDFDSSWSDSHIDSYHTETYTDTETDSDGDTHTVTRTREVYDHTTHIYTYNKNAGESASQKLDALLAGQKSLELNDSLQTASKTNADGEYAAETSRKLPKNQIKLDPMSLMRIASKWKTGSTLFSNLPVINGKWNSLPAHANEWRAAKSKAHSESYITFSHFDSGPIEFQVAESALNDGLSLYSSIDEIIEGINYTQTKAPEFDNAIREFIAVTLDKKESKLGSGKLSSDVRYIAREIYNKNFKNGFDIQGYRLWLMCLMTLLGAGIGGAIGAGLDYLGNEKRWYS